MGHNGCDAWLLPWAQKFANLESIWPHALLLDVIGSLLNGEYGCSPPSLQVHLKGRTMTM